MHLIASLKPADQKLVTRTESGVAEHCRFRSKRVRGRVAFDLELGGGHG